MFTLFKPTESDLQNFLTACETSNFSYTELEATKGDAPEGCVVDRNSVLLGPEDVWESAKYAVRKWKMFDMSWVSLYCDDTPIEVGKVVAIVVAHLGIHSINAARIVYTVDEPNRFGFAYGTLEQHGESGEELFLVERDALTGDVYYKLLAFSRPGHILTSLGYPYARYLQRRFAVDSKAAMLRAIATIG